MTEKVFESERIDFIKPAMELVPDYLEMVNDIEHVARFIGDRREPLTEAEERAYMQDKIDNNAVMFSMIEKTSGKFIGNTEFFDITYSMQDKGYGKEALLRMIDYGFNDLGLERIRITVFVDNPRALHVYEKCGFKEYHRNNVDIFLDMRK